MAIADHGSFDAAARRLHITPSAVSQRIRALEGATGQVLISRGTRRLRTRHGDLAGPARAADPAAARRGEPGARRGFRDRAAGGRQRRLAHGLVPLRCWPRSRGGTASPSGCTWRTRRTRPSCCAAETSWPRSPATRPRSRAAPSRRLGALRYLPAAAPWFADRWRRGGLPRLGGDAGRHLRRQGRSPVPDAPPPRRRRAAAGRPPGSRHGRLLPGGPGRPGLGDAARSRRPAPTWRQASSRCCRRT